MQSLLLADGRRLFVRRWPGDGDPVVILHGLLDSSEGWTRLCERISVPAIAFDLPGFGHSDPSPRGSISGYARDVAEGLAMLGVERFALVGHSLGGAVATALAELMPSQVSSLVLLAPAGFGRIQLAEAAWIPGVRNVLQATLPLVLSSRFAVTAGFRTMVTNGNSPDRDVVERVISRGGQLVVGVREGTRAVVRCRPRPECVSPSAGRLRRPRARALGRPRPPRPGLPSAWREDRVPAGADPGVVRHGPPPAQRAV